jgi:CBS domain-containing protein
MSRRDMYLDAMLRHLGAAYYDTLHGRANPADVNRAVQRVAEQMGEQPQDRASAESQPAGGEQRRAPKRHGRWHTRVSDVMTTSVVTVDRITGYKEIASLLVEHRISGVPVLALGRKVVGVVSEGDLIAAQDKRAGGRGHRAGRLHPGAGHSHQHTGLTAEDLMTSPAVTIQADATVAAAARVMHAQGVRRLPVVDGEGTLVGLVSRRDLLSIFLRPDEDIAGQASDLIADILPGDQAPVKVRVRNGVVTLTGQPGPADQQDLIPVAERLVWDIDGVVDVINKVSTAQTA